MNRTRLGGVSIRPSAVHDVARPQGPGAETIAGSPRVAHCATSTMVMVLGNGRSATVKIQTPASEYSRTFSTMSECKYPLLSRHFGAF